MKPIKKDELYKNLSQFLKSKGVELKEGSYTRGIHAGCSLLADAINLSQAGLERAKVELGRKVQQVRQTIHEKTAPKPPVSSNSRKPSRTNEGKSASAHVKRKTAKKARGRKR